MQICAIQRPRVRNGLRILARGRTMTHMSKTRSEVLAESKRKGLVAGVATAGAVVAAVVHLPIVAAVAAVPAGVYAWRWWKHRAENGIRF